jgi:hypothetical protein
MLDEDEARRQRIERRRRDEKIPAADLETAAADAILPPSPKTKPRFWRRIMSVTGKQRRDEYLREKERQRSRAMTVVTPLRNVAAPQVAPSAPSAVASLSPSAVHQFAKPEPVPVEYRPLREIAPAASPSRLRRLWSWLFVPAPVAIDRRSAELLLQFLGPWTTLPDRAECQRQRERRFRIRSEIARYAFLIVTAAFYILLTCAALNL